MNHIRSRTAAFRALRRFTMSALVALPIIAYAQADDDDELEELEAFTVTGSNIRRLDVETVSPVIRMTSDALKSTGFSTAGDAIRALPIVSGTSLVSIDAGTSFTPGVSSVNLRGLGNNNTLALINGRRAAPFPTPGFNGFQTVVDLNSIPASAIESIDILKDGASAIYGSDAVAGVIAVDLTKSYEGFTTELSFGNTFSTDSFEKQIFAIGGAQSGRTSVVYTVDFRERNGMHARDIAWTRTADGSAVGGFDQRSSANVSANIIGIDTDLFPEFPSGVASLAGLPLSNAMGALPGPNEFLTVDDFEDGPKYYDFQEHAGMFPTERSYGFYTRASYAFTESIEGYVELSYRRFESFIEAAATPAFFINENGDSPSGTMMMPASNPYNPFGVDLLDVRWRMQQVGTRDNDIQSDIPRIVAGLKGDLAFGWTFDTGILYTDSKVTNLNHGVVFDDLLQEALNGVEIEGNTYWANPFGLSHQAVIDYVSGNNPTYDSYKLWSGDFKANGPIVDLGDMGTISAAVGLEHREEEMSSIRTYANHVGNIVGGSQSSSVVGDRVVNAAFAELSIPVYEILEFQVAGRYEDYSDFGDTFKPKFGVKIKPFAGLLLRGAFGKSFRAPDMPYLYSEGSVSFTPQFLADPLRPDLPNQQIKTLGGGNQNLQPEETDSTYVGAVLDFGQFAEPLDGLVFTVDLWRFEQTDLISRIGAATIVANAGDPFFDQFIVRLPPGPGQSVGQIEYVSTQWQNLEGGETQGFDVALQYLLPTENLGEFRFKVETTYQDKFEQTDSFDQTVDFAGTYFFPQWRGTGTIAWRRGDWAASLFIDYIGEFDNLYSDSGTDNVAAYWRFNPQVAYSGMWDTTITVGVRNVFDEAPPVDAASTNTRAVGLHNIEPAFWYVRLAKDW